MLKLSPPHYRSLVYVSIAATLTVAVAGPWLKSSAQSVLYARRVPAVTDTLLSAVLPLVPFYQALHKGDIEFNYGRIAPGNMDGEIGSTIRGADTCLLVADSTKDASRHLEVLRRTTGWSIDKAATFAMGRELQHCLDNLVAHKALGTGRDLEQAFTASTALKAFLPSERHLQEMLRTSDTATSPQHGASDASGDVMGILLLNRVHGVTADEVRGLGRFRKDGEPSGPAGHDTSAWLEPLAAQLEQSPDLGKDATPAQLLEYCRQFVSEHRPSSMDGTVMAMSN